MTDVYQSAARDTSLLGPPGISERRSSHAFAFSGGGRFTGFTITGGRPPTPASLGPDRARPDRTPALGSAVVVVGLIEAVAVRDGQFTPVLRCAEFTRAITLEFTEDMRKQALDNLCRRVVVDGRLHRVEATRYRLEVYRLQAAPRMDEAERS
jgi:hypothetical protein